MRLNIFSAAFLVTSASAAAVAAAPASALMPTPPSVPVVVIASDPEAQASGEALLTVLREHGWFADSAVSITRDAFSDCLARKDAQAACVREAAGWKKERQAAVVILAEGTPVQNWTCVGVGEEPATADRQMVRIDMREAMFGDQKTRFELRNKAAACVLAAASESGW